MNSFCFARDDNQKYREKHKPVAGVYDGQKITTCAWCGKTLAANAGEPKGNK